MTEVYCIGNGEVFLSYDAYIQYCISKGIKPQYEPPVIKRKTMTPESHKTQESQEELWDEIASILFDWPNFNMTDQYKEKLKSKFILTRRNP